MEKVIYVFADWLENKEAQLMGTLYADVVRGKEIFSFEYDALWLQSNTSRILDPELRFFSGRQHNADEEKTNFGLFLDSSPDRWGRVLMQRRVSIKARQMKKENKRLYESDYLLGVHDQTRMGALRFKTDIDGDFLDNNNNQPTPPITKIRELENASLAFEKGLQQDDPSLAKWLNILITPGSSLGGARPKVNVLDTDNSLWIAKFPSVNDQFDIGLWEFLTYQLALDAGVKMAQSKVRKFNSNNHTFLTQRFDRRREGSRIHFASAMTLLGNTDGDDYTSGVSYLDIVEFIIQYGASVKEDLEELFRRIVFSICVKNTDDHLRNHGFLLTDKGWILSPAYDINPNPYGMGLKLNISDTDNSLSLDLVQEQAEYFRLKAEEAHFIIDRVKRSVQKWRNRATTLKISSIEQESMSPAFDL